MDEVKPEGSIEVPIEPQVEPKQEAGEKKYVTFEELDKIRRQTDGISAVVRRIEGALTRQKPIQPAPAQNGQVDEDEVLLEKDWKAAVRKQARIEAQQIFDEEREKARQFAESQQTTQTLENNKQLVREKYPDVDKPGTEIHTRFTRIINEHPEYLGNVYGPKLAMKDMEDELRSEGRLDEFSKKFVEAEVTRRTRADAGALPRASTGVSKGKTVTLSKEQQDFCKSRGLKYEDYARFVSQSNGRSSVEVA